MSLLTDKPDLKSMESALADEKARISKLMYNDKLTDAEQRKLVFRIIHDVKADEAARREFLDIRDEIISLYEGHKKPKSDPFVGCANVQTMITAMVCELLHSKLYPIAYNEDLTYWVPQESTDLEQADGVGKFMKWGLRNIKFTDYVDDYVHNMVLEGTTVTKILWDTEYRWVQRKIPIPESFMRKVKAKFYQILGKQAELELETTDYEVKYEYLKFENPKVELCALEDVGFPCWSIPGSDENLLTHIWHRTRPLVSELKQKARMGYYTNVDTVANQTEKRLQQEGKLQMTKTQSEGTDYVINKEVMVEGWPVERIEWYGQVEIDGMMQECIVWIEKLTETFLGCMPLLAISRKNRRPFVIGQFIRRSHRMYGKTVLDFIKELNKEADSIHDQRLDIGTMAIIPPGIYRAASGTEAEELKMRPGVMIPVDDVNDVRWQAVPNNVLVSFQEERMLMELVEKITSVGSYQSGQESDINRTKATARGTMAIIAQGDQRFQSLGKRIQSPLARTLIKVLELYQQNIPVGLESRVLGEDGQKIFPEGLSVEDLAGNFDVVQAMDTSGGSKIMKKDQNAQLFQMMVPVLAQLHPQGIWELASAVVSDFGHVEVERIIGPRPPSQAQAFDQVQAIMKEVTLIREGRLPKTEDGGSPMATLTALMAFKQSTEGKALEPEKQGLLDTRIAMLRLELLNAVSEQQTKNEMAGGMMNARLQGQSIPGQAVGPQPAVAPAFGPAGATVGLASAPGVQAAGQPNTSNAPVQGAGNAEASQAGQA